MPVFDSYQYSVPSVDLNTARAYQFIVVYGHDHDHWHPKGTEGLHDDVVSHLVKSFLRLKTLQWEQLIEHPAS
jgi:hypothetical protein